MGHALALTYVSAPFDYGCHNMTYMTLCIGVYLQAIQVCNKFNNSNLSSHGSVIGRSSIYMYRHTKSHDNHMIICKIANNNNNNMPTVSLRITGY